MSSKKIKNIRTGALSRGFALARLSAQVGARAAGHVIGSAFSGEKGREDSFRSMLKSQAGTLARELGMLKGSVMKAGQMLSVFGEHLFPPEVNAVLKSLHSDSPSMEWPAIEKHLRRRLGDRLALLEVDTEPLAAASIGQVHGATILSSGERIVLKIQYPGVDRAIEGDLATLKKILRLSHLVPMGPKFDEIFSEVRAMLHREVDYDRELKETESFYSRYGADPRYVVPRTYPEFSSMKVLATSYEKGLKIDDPLIGELSQERRNLLGESMLRLYLDELFSFNKVQTDPHFGNYRIRLSEEKNRPDQLVLYDFGAVRELPESFMKHYVRMVRGSAFLNDQELDAGAMGLGFMLENDSEAYRAKFREFCRTICAPFTDSEPYDYLGSELPERAIKLGAELVVLGKMRPPPREIIFIDRKMGGVFTFLSALRVKLSGRSILEEYV